MSAMRKQVLIAVLGLAMLLMAASAHAAGPVKSQQSGARSSGGNVPPALLAEMGLGGMEVLSDQQGSEVRGSGFFFLPFHSPFFFHSPFVFSHPFYHRHYPFFLYHHGVHGHFFYPFVW
jgi:hypothetical protein